jgi:hypothetical protein
MFNVGTANQFQVTSTGVSSAGAGSTDLNGSGVPEAHCLADGTGCPSTTAAISGMTSGQVAIAGSATTITSSKVLAGSGAGITTGPTSSVANHAATFSGTTGQIQDSNVVITAPGSAATLTPQSGDTYNFPSPPSGSTMTLSGNYWRPNFPYSGVPGVNQLIGIFTPPNDETITINASCTNFKAYEVTAGTTTDTYTLNYWPTNAFGGSATAEAVITFSPGSTVGSFSSCNGSAWTIAPGTGITITNSDTAATGTTVVVSIEGTHTN